MWTTDASAVALLSKVLARAHNLQKVTLWGSEALFKAYPDFGLGSSASVHTVILGGDVAPLPALARAFPHVHQLIFVGGGACVPEWAFASPSVDPQALSAWRESDRRGANKGRRFQKDRDELELCFRVASGKQCEFGAEYVVSGVRR